MSNQILPPGEDFLPQTDGKQNLGATDNHFRTIYVDNIVPSPPAPSGIVYGTGLWNTIPSGMTIEVPEFQNFLIIKNLTIYGQLQLGGLIYTLY